MRFRFPRIPVALILLLNCHIASAQPRGREDLVLTPDHADGVYQVGQTVTWTVEWKSTQPPPDKLSYSIKRGQLIEVGGGTLTLSENVGRISATFDQPGTLLAEVTAATAGSAAPPTTLPTPRARPLRVLGGAIADPQRIQPSAQAPDDFDQFWADKIQQLQSIPINAQLEKADAPKADAAKAGVDYYKIVMDNIRGTHIRGQLARPTAGAKFPAILIVQWAGVYKLEKSWVTDRAAEGWLALNIEAHDIPIDESPDFYRRQFDGPLKNYWAIGNDDRETSYFLRMYLSCYRAADYLASRPDWDGKTLVVMGGSQGGQQSLLTAAIYPGITAAMAAVPAGSDMLGPDIGRRGGWPQWYESTAGKDPAKVHQASRYFDITNFAPRIHCPVLVGLGLIDETCPAAGVFATLNQIKSPKEIVILPHGDHHGTDPKTSAYGARLWEAWLPALLKGGPPPVGGK